MAPPKEAAAGPPQSVEISAIGSYPMPATWKQSGKAELAVLDVGHWHPTTVDFEAVANVPNHPKRRTFVIEVGTFSELLGVITQTTQGVPRPNATIARLNIISHANPGVIGLSGTVADDGSCALGQFDINDALGSKGIDASAMSWLNTTGQSLRDDARTRFTADAEIWLVVCNGAVGVSAGLVLDMSAAFGVRVAAYKAPVHYWPEKDAQATRVTKRTTTSIGLTGTKGEGYFCWVKVPASQAGQHLTIQGLEDNQGKRVKMPLKP